MRWLVRTTRYYRWWFDSAVTHRHGWCHILPHTSSCTECRYFWTDAHR